MGGKHGIEMWKGLLGCKKDRKRERGGSGTPKRPTYPPTNLNPTVELSPFPPPPPKNPSIPQRPQPLPQQLLPRLLTHDFIRRRLLGGLEFVLELEAGLVGDLVHEAIDVVLRGGDGGGGRRGGFVVARGDVEIFELGFEFVHYGGDLVGGGLVGGLGGRGGRKVGILVGREGGEGRGLLFRDPLLSWRLPCLVLRLPCCRLLVASSPPFAPCLLRRRCAIPDAGDLAFRSVCGWHSVRRFWRCRGGFVGLPGGFGG